jgi:hypothetical protein
MPFLGRATAGPTALMPSVNGQLERHLCPSPVRAGKCTEKADKCTEKAEKSTKQAGKGTEGRPVRAPMQAEKSTQCGPGNASRAVLESTKRRPVERR